jgi:hypothetical protein
MSHLRAFSPVTDAELDQARRDPAFRLKLLSQSLEALLAGLQKLRNAAPSASVSVTQIREGVQLAVRLAELIQTAAGPARGS